MGTLTFTKEQFAEARRRKREEGFPVILPAASDEGDAPFQARIRRISLNEKAAVNGISQELQEQVWVRTQEYVAWMTSFVKRQNASNFEDIGAMVEEARLDTKLEDAVNSICVAAFIEPRLTEDAAVAATDPNVWHVDSIPWSDRYLVYEAITTPEGEEAKSLGLFRQKPAADVPGNEAMPAATAAK